MDRAKDIIISGKACHTLLPVEMPTDTEVLGGENISSVSLEGMLARHPDIIEVGVIAVQDSHFGERPKAFVTTSNSALKGEDVIIWAKNSSQISGFMV